jgi:ADP-heptose:LPS heptosyltransferase
MTTDGKSPRILLVRLSAIGDVIHGLPIAVALRERFPQAFLAWAVEERAAGLLEGHPAIDQRIVLPRGWLRSPAAVWRVRKELKAHRFDTAIDAQGLTKSAVAAWLSGARRRIGMGGRWGRELSRWLNTTLVDTDDLHAIERGLKLLEPLGIASPSVRFQVPETADHRRAAEAIIRQLGLAQAKADSPVFADTPIPYARRTSAAKIGTVPSAVKGDSPVFASTKTGTVPRAKTGTVPSGFVLIISGAGWPSKLWPVERYAAVAEYLARRWNLASLLAWGNDAERARAEQIAAASAGRAILAPRVTLLELAALARRAQFAIGSDTGPLHLAAAAGAPCIGLYGPWPADKHGPYGPQHINVQKMCMDGTTRQRRQAPSTYMAAIDVPSVCTACDRMLQRRYLLDVA